MDKHKSGLATGGAPTSGSHALRGRPLQPAPPFTPAALPGTLGPSQLGDVPCTGLYLPARPPQPSLAEGRPQDVC